MGIGIPDLNAFEDFMAQIPQILTNEIIRALTYLGEQCVKRIRDRSPEDSWFDQTGNLRSSIGYAVLDHGRKTIVSAFDSIGGATDGPAKGQQLIESLTSQYADVYALLVVAGMEYAEFVEAKDNKDVLAATDLWAKQQIQTYMEKAMERASKKISQLQKQLGL